MALGLAVNARGADHNRSGAYEADLSGELDRLDGGPAHVAAAVETEDRAAVMDSLILCKFLRGVFTDPFTEWAGLLSAVTGWEVSGGELRETARRIVMAKRVYNIREGWQPAALASRVSSPAFEPGARERARRYFRMCGVSSCVPRASSWPERD
jgi:aldehyde:ferredoxin oxidoreductase